MTRRIEPQPGRPSAPDRGVTPPHLSDQVRGEDCDRDDDDDHRLTRDDCDTFGDWLRYLHESGLEPKDVGRANWVGVQSADPAVQRHQAVFGHNRQQYQRSWESWGSTKYLTTKQFRQGYDAVALANCYGFVLNAFINITWSTVGITGDAAVADANGRYLELLRKACLKRQIIPACVWVIENGRTWGLHSHVLASIPREKKDWLRYQAEQAVETIAGRRPVRTLGSRTVKIIHRQDGDWKAQWRIFRYMMKGLRPTKRHPNPEIADGQRRLEEVAGLKLRSQGIVGTKRFGVSRKLDAKSLADIRRVHGLSEFALERGETSPEALFTNEYLCAHYERTRPRREAERAAEFERSMTELQRTLHI